MVLPVIIGVGIAAAVGWIWSWFCSPPEQENPTMREARQRAEQEEMEQKARARQEEAERERDRFAAELEQKRKELEKLEKRERKRLERERIEREERKRAEEKKEGESKAKQEAEKSKREAERSTAEAEMTAQQHNLIRQRQELKDCEAQMRAKEQDLLAQTKLAHDSARAAQQQLETGLQPIKWPTTAEIQHARDLVQYDVKNFHFAIVGKSGSGKSSLINAFLNLGKGQPGAAATGVTETTATIGRYPDPGLQRPRPWTVWYDVPGAGTQNVSAWQYFINQGLFVFDVILIAIGDRFEETDVQLLKDCHRFKIPALIVRSKADMHIDNLIKEDGGWGESVDRELYQRCRETFVTESKQMVRDELVKAHLEDQQVYLVSSYTLRAVYNQALSQVGRLPPNLIDEQALIQDLMVWTVKRRGGDSTAFQTALEVATQGNGLFRSAVQAGRNISSRVQAATAQTATARTRNAARPTRALPEEPVVEPEAPPDYEEVQPQPDNRSTRPRPPTPNNRNRTPYVVWTKRVLYLPWRLKPHQLNQELNAHNPYLAQVSAAPPRIISGTVAVLNFLPGQIIPDEVELFGRMLRLQPFREPNTNTHREQSTPTGAHGQSSRTSGRDKPATTAKKQSAHPSPTAEEVEDEQW